MAYQRMLFTYLLLVAVAAIAALSAAPIGRTLDGALGTVEVDQAQPGGPRKKDSSLAQGSPRAAGGYALASTPVAFTAVARASYPEQVGGQAEDRPNAEEPSLRWQ